MTTVMTAMSSEEQLLTGREVYTIHGGAIPHDKVREIFKGFAGLKRRWNCLEKAHLVKARIGGQVILGSTFVLNKEMNGSYGHAFNPPYEFHAWVELKDKQIVDLALPGLIETGLETADDQGYILQHIEPIILCAYAPHWIQYTPYFVDLQS